DSYDKLYNPFCSNGKLSVFNVSLIVAESLFTPANCYDSCNPFCSNGKISIDNDTTEKYDMLNVNDTTDNCDMLN
ncbi:hypothetical protein ACJMK2_001882, partial [Sinanodonta woodiana]